MYPVRPNDSNVMNTSNDGVIDARPDTENMGYNKADSEPWTDNEHMIIWLFQLIDLTGFQRIQTNNILWLFVDFSLS